MALTTVPASLSATALTLTTAAQPNITSVGTLTGLTVSGNIAGTLTTAAQTNITSLGTLTGLAVGGTIQSTSEISNIGASGSATNNRLKLTYNSTNGTALIGPHSTGGNTTLALGTSNSGTYANALTIANDGDVTFAGAITTSAVSTFSGSTTDYAIVVSSTDAYTGIRFTDPDRSGNLFYRGAVNHMYLHDSSFSVAGQTLASGYKFQVNGNSNFTGDIAVLSDSKKVFLGASSDLQIYHDGSNNVINQQNNHSLRIAFAGTNQWEFHSSSYLKGNDGKKIILGDSSDLQIYHDGSNSWLKNSTGSLNLEIATDKVLNFNAGIGEIGNVTGFQAMNSAGTANTDFGIRATTIRFATGSAERMRITSDGYVSLNRGANEYGLELKSAGSRSGLVLKKPGTDTIQGSLLMLADETLRLGTASVYNIQMDQSGNVFFPGGRVGINQTSASRRKLEITDQSPGIVFHDTNVTNLTHEIIGGGNAGLEISADYQNVGTGYIRLDIGGNNFHKFHEGGSILNRHVNSTQGRHFHVGTISPWSNGNRYLHVQLSTSGNAMLAVHVFGYSYLNGIIEGMGVGYNYNNANQSAMYNHYENGSVANMWQNSSNSYSEVVIDTVGTATSNRWGAIAIYATDDLGQTDKLEIVQYAFNASAARLYT